MRWTLQGSLVPYRYGAVQQMGRTARLVAAGDVDFEAVAPIE